jgi:hypothetical protein
MAMNLDLHFMGAHFGGVYILLNIMYDIELRCLYSLMKRIIYISFFIFEFGV